METEKTLNDLTQDYKDLLEHLESKSNTPDWFNVIFKNILNKTVSLEEWNTFMNYIQNNSSDINSISAFVQAVYQYLLDLGPLDASNFYNKEESDNKFQTKSDMSNYYNRTESYSQTEINSLLNNKLNVQIISLNGTNGTLTEEELNKVLNNQNIIIEKDGLYYYKTGDVNGYLVFTKLSFDLTLFTNYNAVIKYVIDIYKSNGNWTYRAITLYTYTKQQTDTLLNDKQPTLISGTNIKTINNVSLLGSGNIDIASANHLYQIEVIFDSNNIRYLGLFLFASPLNLNAGTYTRAELYASIGYQYIRGSGSAMNMNNEIIRANPIFEISFNDFRLIFNYYDTTEQDWQDDIIILDSVHIRKIF